MRTRKLYANPYVRREKSYTMENGEALTFAVDWSTYLDYYGSTISASTWSTQQTGLITLSGDTTTGNVTSVLVTAIAEDIAILTNKVTFSDGQIEKRIFRITVKETDDSGDR